MNEVRGINRDTLDSKHETAFDTVDMDELIQLAHTASPEDLPRLAGLFAQAQAVVYARLASPRPQPAAAVREPDRLLTMKEVAERLNVKEEHARELGRKGLLPVVRVGERYVRVKESALRKWMGRS